MPTTAAIRGAGDLRGVCAGNSTMSPSVGLLIFDQRTPVSFLFFFFSAGAGAGGGGGAAGAAPGWVMAAAMTGYLMTVVVRGSLPFSLPRRHQGSRTFASSPGVW